MSEYIFAGSTAQSIDVFLQDSSSSTGAGLTGLVYNASGLTAYYRKGATGSPVAISLQARTLGQAWASGGFCEVDSTNMPGVYRLDLPDLMIDTAGYVTLYLRGATNLLQTAVRIQCGTIPADVRQLNGSTQNADRMPISDTAQRTIKITGSNHVAADIHETQPDSIHETTFDADALSARVLAADAVSEIQAGLALQSTLLLVAGYVDTEIASIKAVTDKLNTGLVADGGVYQFTANMLELAPGGGGGGSATLENQQLILDEIDTLRASFASAVGRLAVASQLIGFPASIIRNSDYSTTTESEIRISLKNLDGNPITEIGGVPCDEITWLFGLGSERSPAIIEGAATWDDVNSQLIIEIDAEDTAATPTGTLSWQIGCTIDTVTRYLGGGTTRLLERHF